MLITAKADVESKSKKVTKQKLTKEPKTPKPDTKLASYNLYKDGKSTTEIANERVMAISTIEGHLAHYVSLGMIPVTQFITEEKFKKVIAIAKQYEDGFYAPIKQELGDGYSYSEIKFALATLKNSYKEKDADID